MSEKSTLRVRQVKSAIGCDRRQRATLRGMGIRHLNHTVELEDTRAVRGMIGRVKHLVIVVEEQPDAG